MAPVMVPVMVPVMAPVMALSGFVPRGSTLDPTWSGK